MEPTQQQIKQTQKVNNLLRKSTIAINTIKDNVLSQMLNGKLYNVEDSDNFICKILDLNSGIDYIVDDGIGYRGLSIRVQWNTAYNSFTIRNKMESGSITEYQKTVNHINNGYLYPYWTSQAYFNEKTMELLSIAIIKTFDLYDFIYKYPQLTLTNKSDNEFIVVRWKDLIDKGYAVLTKK